MKYLWIKTKSNEIIEMDRTCIIHTKIYEDSSGVTEYVFMENKILLYM